jgi:hypothetical protein
MKVKYFIDKQRRLIRTTAEESIRFDDIRSHQDRLLADPDFDVSFDQLIDTTPAMKFDLSPDEARIIAERRIVSPKSRRAFVAIKPHIFGLGRMMEIHHTRLECAYAQVFYSMKEGLKWLEREEERTLRI